MIKQRINGKGRKGNMKQDIKIVLENGVVIPAESFGKRKDLIGDFIFNTSIAGYQEVLTDPSYYQEVVVMTFPVQGIYGINKFDDESKSSSPSAFIVGEYEKDYSNNHATESLNDYLIRKNIQGVSGVDTRYLTKLIREKGSMKGAIVDINANEEQIIKELKAKKLTGHVPAVSPSKIEIKNPKGKKTAVFFDFGAKDSIEDNIVNRGYKVVRVPYDTKYEAIKKYNPDVVFLSNGPGDPAELKGVVKEVKAMIKAGENVCGICLGHQLISIALGAKTYRLKFGHHAINHPVVDIETGKVYITTQNHNYSVDEKTLPKTVVPFLKSVHDKTVEGIRHTKKNVIAVQFHPEAGPGPSDGNEIFDRFFNYFNKGGNNA